MEPLEPHKGETVLTYFHAYTCLPLKQPDRPSVVKSDASNHTGQAVCSQTQADPIRTRVVLSDFGVFSQQVAYRTESTGLAEMSPGIKK